MNKIAAGLDTLQYIPSLRPVQKWGLSSALTFLIKGKLIESNRKL